MPITRNKKSNTYPLYITFIKDICYYTTPNFIGYGMYCANPYDTEHFLKALTT